MTKRLITVLICVVMVFAAMPVDRAAAATNSLRIYGIFMKEASGKLVTSDRYGDAVLLQSSGQYLLMDVGASMPKKGDSTVYRSNLKYTLKKIGVKKLDIYISHVHDDHAGGIQAIYNNFDVGKVYLPDIETCKYYSTPTTGTTIKDIYKRHEKKAKAAGAQVIYLSPPFRNHTAGKDVRSSFTFGSTKVKILGPVGTYRPKNFADQDGDCGTKEGHCLNNCSLTAMVTCGNFRFLTAGDIEKQEENKLVKKYGTALHCDVMKASHHSLYTSNTANFLKKAKPTWSFDEDHGYWGATDEAKNRFKGYGYNYAVGDNKTTFVVRVQDNKVRIYKDKNNDGKLSSGELMTGWISIKKEGAKRANYQFYTKKGYMLRGWSRLNSELYYMGKKNGFKFRGEHTIKNVKCTFDDEGVLIDPKRPGRVTMKSAKALKNHRIRIRWEEASKATGYRIYRATSENGTYKKIGYVAKDVTTYVDTDRTKGKTYYYKVRAIRKIAGAKLYGYKSAAVSAKSR